MHLSVHLNPSANGDKAETGRNKNSTMKGHWNLSVHCPGNPDFRQQAGSEPHTQSEWGWSDDQSGYVPSRDGWNKLDIYLKDKQRTPYPSHFSPTLFIIVRHWQSLEGSPTWCQMCILLFRLVLVFSRILIWKYRIASSLIQEEGHVQYVSGI